MNALELGLAAIDKCLTDELVRAKCRALLYGYNAMFRDAGYVTLEVEKYLEAPLTNPDTNKNSRTFRMAGKVDAICELHGKQILFDHKTTSMDITDPNAPYWRQLVVEGQASHYQLLLWMNGNKVDETIWDVVRKPTISPRKLTKAELAAFVADGIWCGRRFTEDDRYAMSQATEARETPAMYEARLAHDCTFERPEWYFQRRPVARLDAEILEYSREIWEHGQEILHARQTKRNARNSGACMLYGSPCRFLGICSGYDDPDSEKWQRKEFVHKELPVQDGDGKELLTNSRIRNFQTCRRKHFFDYELGIERIDEEEREALLFGQCWHTGLEKWFLSFKKESENEYGQADSPANEAGQSTVAASDAG